MAIEKLTHGYNEGDRSSSGPSGTDIINKINEIVDYINSDAEIDHIASIVEDRRGVEQEPNKVELVPLDVEEILDCMTNAHLTKDAVRAILSKYGVPTQQPVIDWENPIVSIDHGKGIEDQTCRVVSVKDDKGKTYVIDICQYSELAEKQFFTPDYVNDRVEDNSERIQPLGEKSIIKMFLRDNGLIEE